MQLLKNTLVITTAVLLFTASFFSTSCTTTVKGTFEIGNGEFLLNGEPFVVKAAEIHYPRIPAEYWEHRIEMCKALGMNTICLYVFWNIHEQRPGEFDFKGQNDIARFCKLAQKHGMWVIVRPGPYVCAEWEMGGLPWWLLKDKDIQLRTSDPRFVERTWIFMNEVGRQLADHQITRGGNILMVQVENEYGAYATDKEYIGTIRDIVKRTGFIDVPLFQCDWSSSFERNGLEDLLWTINFGAGANIDDMFRKLHKVRPDTPLMCSEYWSGWFDHWGRKHETRKASVLAGGLDEMLSRNISFSLYMAHGGTTFGHWGGANSPSYSAMCSSYDYDAPISEAGWRTPKFDSVRTVMTKYTDEPLPVVPDTKPVIEIPSIEFTLAAPLFDNLPEPSFSEEIRTMEEFDQGWGTILYRTTLPEITTPSKLAITEVHDWAQVFVDGELIGTLDRRHYENMVDLPTTREGARLDILVEAMGRVNFGRAIHDFKGITEKVELLSKGQSTALTGWEVYSFPPDYSFAACKNFGEVRHTSSPSYYKAVFTLDTPGDTFLDMRTWGKGMVWVNGHSIGRFWEIGPQQTLYMPGCWLKKGKNEIVVLDLKGPSEPAIAGIKAPILDELRVKAPKTHRAEGETLNLKGIKPLHSGVFLHGNGWQDVRFGKTARGRWFVLNALSSHDGSSVVSVAEINIQDENGNNIPREAWRMRYASSEQTVGGNRTADKVFDLQESTYWSSDAKEFPHSIVIDLGDEYSISGFSYLPRMEKDVPGMIKDYEVYLSEKGLEYSL